jgi:hypothetical protein
MHVAACKGVPEAFVCRSAQASPLHDALCTVRPESPRRPGIKNYQLMLLSRSQVDNPTSRTHDSVTDKIKNAWAARVLASPNLGQRALRT